MFHLFVQSKTWVEQQFQFKRKPICQISFIIIIKSFYGWYITCLKYHWQWLFPRIAKCLRELIHFVENLSLHFYLNNSRELLFYLFYHIETVIINRHIKNCILHMLFHCFCFMLYHVIYNFNSYSSSLQKIRIFEARNILRIINEKY